MDNSYSHIPAHITAIRHTLPQGVTLICVSKFHPVEAIRAAYDAGERDFGESRVQELLLKHERLPQDIRWHFIGHLQTNKVRSIIPFVHLIHSVDSEHLMATIQREAARIGRTVNVLLEVHVARETTKSGFLPDELENVVRRWKTEGMPYPNIHVLGVMGMASLTDDEQEIRRCFREIHRLALLVKKDTPIVSMGMSDDYLQAVDEGSTMVRIGTDIFGTRQ